MRRFPTASRAAVSDPVPTARSPFASKIASVATLPEPPLGVAHVPSPRQNVVELALVPLLRFATGRFPVTPVESGNPVQLVRVPELGVPRAGVTSVGDVALT